MFPFFLMFKNEKMQHHVRQRYAEKPADPLSETEKKSSERRRPGK